MTQVGTGKYTYELIRDFFRMPPGEALGVVSRVATDSQDRVYVFQRKDPPVVVFDRDGKYLGAWGSGAVRDPHGLKIVDDIVRRASGSSIGSHLETTQSSSPFPGSDTYPSTSSETTRAAVLRSCCTRSRCTPLGRMCVRC